MRGAAGGGVIEIVIVVCAARAAPPIDAAIAMSVADDSSRRGKVFMVLQSRRMARRTASYCRASCRSWLRKITDARRLVDLCRPAIGAVVREISACAGDDAVILVYV